MSAVSETAPDYLAQIAEILTIAMGEGHSAPLREALAAQATELATLREQLAVVEAERDNQKRVADEGLAHEAELKAELKTVSALLREAQAARESMETYVEYLRRRVGESAGVEAWEAEVFKELGNAVASPARINHPGPVSIKPDSAWHLSRLLYRRQTLPPAPQMPAPTCPSTCTDCDKAAACEPARPFAELTRPEKLAKVSDSLLLHFAQNAEPGSDAHYDIVMEMTGRGMTTPIEPATATDAAPIRLGAKIGAAAGSLPSGGEAAEVEELLPFVVVNESRDGSWNVRAYATMREALTASRLPGCKTPTVFGSWADFDIWKAARQAEKPAAPTTIEKKGGRDE